MKTDEKILQANRRWRKTKRGVVTNMYQKLFKMAET